ncbi:hypothetical protein CHS0354_000380 [Potamilus streckersoni]|uniref:Actin-related protein 2/3 complex subunit 5 n=1 Tax=Potamilus streckersoni TaxID=2493646 RepID=A0AAE0SMS2_9BIVA|nr:hypothetical protein CHS0354_000380 [Potamilus streckersoni]
MAKNTGASKFRKVDVDQYDEEIYVEEAEQQEEGDQGPSESEVNTFLAQGKNAEALGVVLKNPPVGTKNQAVKDRAVQLAVRVLTTFKSSEIDPALKSLDSKSLDTLMKYIYRGFEFPTENSSAALLTWHEKTFAVGGLGAIVRVLTDRKRV